MFRESILLWTLILMVVISLFLSFSIWARVPGNLDSIGINEADAEIDPVSVIKPEKIIVFFGNSFNTMLKFSSPLYKNTWEVSRNLLNSCWISAPELDEDVNREFLSRNKGIEVFFPVSLPGPFLKELFGISSDVPTLEGKLIESFVLIDDGKLKCFIKDAEDKFYNVGTKESSLQLINLIEKINKNNPPLYARLNADVNLKVNGDVYISLFPYELPVYSLERDSIYEQSLVSKFFSDFSITRRIEEKDGTIIYTDGRQGIRIYSDGAIEYSLPVSRQQRKNQTLFDAFLMAIDFVTSHGGWPEGVYLDSYKIEEGSFGQAFIFSFKVWINGFKVVNMEDFITVRVEGNQVSNYYRNSFFTASQEGLYDLMAPVEALNTAVSTKNIKVINDVYPGYMIKEEKLIPIWVVETGGKEVIIQNLSE